MLIIIQCRRSSLALIGMCLLAYLGVRNNTDVSIALAGIVASVAAANQYVIQFQQTVGTEDSYSVRPRRFNVSVTTTIYLVAQLIYTTIGTGSSLAGRSSISAVRIA